MFPDLTIGEQIQLAVAVGAEGLGVDEAKLGGKDPVAIKALLDRAGLRAAMCVPFPMCFLPTGYDEGPRTVEARTAAMCESIRRLAVLEPDSVLCLTGPNGELSMDDARSLSLEALREVADVAAEFGLPVAFETFRYSDPANWSVVFGVEDGVTFIDEARRDNIGMCYDIWHLWDSSDRILGQTKEIARRVLGVHVADYRQPTRSWNDRVLPGDGVIDFPAFLQAFREGGFDGWYDLEVFSDDGRWGNDYPDSVWKLSPLEQARRGREGLIRAWEASYAR
jgi:sugar phosphate isomerase/epimerase